MKSEREIRGRLDLLYGQLVTLRHKPKPQSVDTRQKIEHTDGSISALEWVLSNIRERTTVTVVHEMPIEEAKRRWPNTEIKR